MELGSTFERGRVITAATLAGVAMSGAPAESQESNPANTHTPAVECVDQSVQLFGSRGFSFANTEATVKIDPLAPLKPCTASDFDRSAEARIYERRDDTIRLLGKHTVLTVANDGGKPRTTHFDIKRARCNSHIFMKLNVESVSRDSSYAAGRMIRVPKTRANEPKVTCN
jgi:hypothetical protein